MAERNGERHLELAARPQCVALLDRASRARTAFGTVETQSERAQLDEAGAAPAASLDHGLPDGRPQSRAEDPALVAFTRPRREHAHRSRQSAAGRGALEKSVELQAFAQRHFGPHQQRAAHRIGVLPHGWVVGRARDLRRELALVLEPAVRPIELYRHDAAGRAGQRDHRIRRHAHRAERPGGEFSAKLRLGSTGRLRHQLDRAAESAGAELRAENAAANDHLAYERGWQRGQVDGIAAGPLERNAVEQHERLIGRRSAQRHERGLSRAAAPLH